MPLISTTATAMSGKSPFNVASGGTLTTFTYNGYVYNRHLFAASGNYTLTIARSVAPFRVTMIGGGGESGYADNLAGDGTPGGSGGGYFVSTTLPSGLLAIQVGAPCSGSYINVAANDSTVAGIGTVGGGGHGLRTWNSTGRTNGRTGTWAGNSTGGNGATGNAYTTPSDPSVSFRTLVDGTVGTWGKYGNGIPAAGSGTNPGITGMVCIEYPTSKV